MSIPEPLVDHGELFGVGTAGTIGGEQFVDERSFRSEACEQGKVRVRGEAGFTKVLHGKGHR